VTPDQIGRILVARDVYSGEDAGFLMAMAGENVNGKGPWIDFQLSLDPTEQDTRLGMDTYCVATDEGRTHYGGIERVEAGPEHVDVVFTAEAATKLQLPPRLRIDLQQVAPLAASFVEVLQRIVG
jgi:hypothetical protein